MAELSCPHCEGVNALRDPAPAIVDCEHCDRSFAPPAARRIAGAAERRLYPGVSAGDFRDALRGPRRNGSPSAPPSEVSLPLSAVAEAYGAPRAVALASVLAVLAAIAFFLGSSKLRAMDVSVQAALDADDESATQRSG